MSRFEILFDTWTKLKPVKFVIITTILSVALTVPIFILYEVAGLPDKAIGGFDFGEYGIISILFIGILAGPVLETALAQALPIFLVQKFIRWKTNLVSVLISTLLFAAGHLEYSVWYFILVIPTGVLLALTYIVFQNRKESGFWMTFSVHSLRNSIPAIITISQILK